MAKSGAGSSRKRGLSSSVSQSADRRASRRIARARAWWDLRGARRGSPRHRARARHALGRRGERWQRRERARWPAGRSRGSPRPDTSACASRSLPSGSEPASDRASTVFSAMWLASTALVQESKSSPSWIEQLAACAQGRRERVVGQNAEIHLAQILMHTARMVVEPLDLPPSRTWAARRRVTVIGRRA